MASKIRDRIKPNDDRRLKKLTYQLKFLREELCERKEFLDLYKLELYEAVSKYLAEIEFTPLSDSGQDLQDVHSKNVSPHMHSDFSSSIESPDEAGDGEKDAKPSPELKKLYRQIVLQTHPDKLQHMDDVSSADRDERRELYQQACEAFKLRKIDDLIEMALYLGIDVEMPLPAKIKMIQGQIKNAEESINEIGKMALWKWGNSFGDNSARAKILGAVCVEMGAAKQDDKALLNFIERYDMDAPTSFRRKVGTRPEKRKYKRGPKR